MKTRLAALTFALIFCAHTLFAADARALAQAEAPAPTDTPLPAEQTETITPSEIMTFSLMRAASAEENVTIDWMEASLGFVWNADTHVWDPYEGNNTPYTVFTVVNNFSAESKRITLVLGRINGVVTDTGDITVRGLSADTTLPETFSQSVSATLAPGETKRFYLWYCVDSDAPTLRGSISIPESVTLTIETVDA